jgi:hypothetical protein
MAKKSGSSFGNFNKTEIFDTRSVKPITTEFSKGSVPDSLYAVNRESAWSRWRRGYEIATACFYDNSYDYPFTYRVPVPAGTPTTSGNQPTIPGVFKGFPTTNKEFGMHWAGVRVAGSLRFDNVFDSTGVRASIVTVTEDSDFWYVKLNGSWSVSTPLPPPLYVAIPGVPGGLKAINGEILEDRIITPGGVPIDRDTIDPATQKRYGYVSAVLADTDPFTGTLKIRKSGSVDVVQELISNNYSGNVNIDGSVTASYFVGDGSQLTNITVDQAATIQRSFTNSSTWVVNHNLNTVNPIAQVYDGDDYQIIPETLRVTDNNTITVTFENARSGYVVVAKGGHIVSGSISAENIDGLDTSILNEVNSFGVFSSSAQITLSGDVTGTANATVIGQVDGGSI